MFLLNSFEVKSARQSKVLERHIAEYGTLQGQGKEQNNPIITG